MRGNHLLVLGCRFDNWLTRFFLRTARSLELSQKRRRWDMLVGDHLGQDADLALFLESFCPDTRVIPLTATQFVTELTQRWDAAHPAEAQDAEPEAREAGKDARSIPPGAVFISYASEDLEAANRLAEGLRIAGLEVWFDKQALADGRRLGSQHQARHRAVLAVSAGDLPPGRGRGEPAPILLAGVERRGRLRPGDGPGRGVHHPRGDRRHAHRLRPAPRLLQENAGHEPAGREDHIQRRRDARRARARLPPPAEGGASFCAWSAASCSRCFSDVPGWARRRF